MTSFDESGSSNDLLTALPPDVLKEMEVRFQSVELRTGDMLYEAGTPLRHAYFPVSAVVSLFSPLLNGVGAEVAVVGREGVVGVCTFLGGAKSLSSAVVQHAGRALRIGARDINEMAREFEPVMRHLLRYTQVLFTNMAQTSVCHSHHSLHSQLCSWLLQHLDRQVEEDIYVTQERIAGMLGVRREGVTAAALKLQSDGVIRYHRGLIKVLDRRELEHQSCECYGVMNRAFEQLRAGSSEAALSGDPHHASGGCAVSVSRQSMHAALVA